MNKKISDVSSLKAWENILQTPELLEYFRDIFNSLGISIEETSESFTVHYTDGGFLFEPGVKEEEVDFIVPLGLENIENMVKYAEDGIISADESWRILDVLFTPLTKAVLENPIMSMDWLWKLAGVEDLTHVYLINPSGGDASTHTLVHLKSQWLVLKGLYGTPERIYRMTPEQSLEYQREVFSAMQKNSPLQWKKFASFYKEWRESCSVKVK